MSDKIPFIPIKGTEAEIRSIPSIQEGAIYFALDTKKIFYGSSENNLLIPMGGNSGIYFGNKNIEEDSDIIWFSDINDLEREDGDMSLFSLNIKDLILNKNGSFYKVIDSSVSEDGEDILYQCQKVTVSGGGGGGSEGPSATGSITIELGTFATSTVLVGTDADFILPFSFETKNSEGEKDLNIPATIMIQKGGTSDSQWSTYVGEEGKNLITLRDYTSGSYEINIKDICKDTVEQGETRRFRIRISGYTGGEKETITYKYFSLYFVPAKTTCSDIENAKYNTLFYNINENFTLNYTFSGLGLYHYVELLIDDNIVYQNKNNLIQSDGVITNYLIELEKTNFNVYEQSFLPIKFNIYANSTSNLDTFKCIKTFEGFIMTYNESLRDYIIGVPIKNYDLIQYDLIEIPVVIYGSENEYGVTLNYANDQGNSDPRPNIFNKQWEIFNFSPQEAGRQIVKFDISGENVNVILEFNVAAERWKEIGTEVLNPRPAFKFLANNFTSTKELQSYALENNIIFSDNFDFVNGGIKTEKAENGLSQSYLLIKSGTTVTFPYEIFNIGEPTIREVGRNFKIIFEAIDCEKYDCELGGYGSILKQKKDPDSLDGLMWEKDPETGEYIRDEDDQLIPVYEERDNKNYFILKAQYADIYIGKKIDNIKYVENQIIELDFNINNSIDDDGKRYIETWVNGTPYSIKALSNNSLSIPGEQLILGSNECDLKIYLIKGYYQSLNNYNRLRNFIADGLTYQEKKERYIRNNVLIEGSTDLKDISIPALIDANPECVVHVYEIDRLPTDKIKKDGVESCKYKQYKKNYNKLNEPYVWHNDCKLGIQGTSSLNYILSAGNLDTDFKYNKAEGADNQFHYGRIDDNGAWTDVDTTGNYITSKGYKLTKNSIPCTYLNTKVNVASAENANNALLQDEYNLLNPFQSVVKSLDSANGLHRDTIEFTNGLLFFIDKNKNTKTSAVANTRKNLFCENEKYMENILNEDYNVTPQFYGICNVGNSKKNEEVFHRPDEICVECLDNPNVYAMMYAQADESTFGDGFEFRYEPDFNSSYAQDKDLDPTKTALDYWLDFTEWMVKYNPASAPLENEHQSLPSGLETETFSPFKFTGKQGVSEWLFDCMNNVSIDNYAGTYQYDCYNYRMAKMLSECENHLAMDSLVFHYLFIEKHTMIDNVVKNTFWSANADSKYTIWDLSKDYDNDTADGNNNSGYLTIDYGYECFDENFEIQKETALADPIYEQLIDEETGKSQYLDIDSENTNTVLLSELEEGQPVYPAYEENPDGNDPPYVPIIDSETGEQKYWDLDTEPNLIDEDDENIEGKPPAFVQVAEKEKKSSTLFNGAQWCSWINFIGGLESVLAAAYKDLSKNERWLYPTQYLNKVKAWQNQLPEICWILDAYRKYKRPNNVFNDRSYLKRLEGGKKIAQREAFEIYQTKYLNSKYLASEEEKIMTRGHFNQNLNASFLIPVKCYQKCYLQGSLRRGQYKFQKQRVLDLNNFYFFKTPITEGGSGETIIELYYPELISELGISSDYGLIYNSEANTYQLSSLEDYENNDIIKYNSSLLELGFQDLSFEKGTHLSSIVLGDAYDKRRSIFCGETDAETINFENTLVKNIDFQNYAGKIINAEIDLSSAKKLKYLNLTGTTCASLFIADNAPLETLIINNITDKLQLSNLYKLQEINFANETQKLKNLTALDCVNIDINNRFSQQLFNACGNSLKRYRLLDIVWRLSQNTEIDNINNKINVLEQLFNLDSDTEHNYTIDSYNDSPSSLSQLLSGKLYIDSNIEINDPTAIYKRYILGDNERESNNYTKDLNIIIENNNSKLYDFEIYNGDGQTIQWKSKFHTFSDINNNFFTFGILQNSLGSFNKTDIFKNDDNDATYTFNNKWNIYLYNEDLEIIDQQENIQIDNFNNYNFSDLFVGKIGHIKCMPLFTSEEKLYKINITFSKDGSELPEKLSTQSFYLSYNASLEDIISKITIIPWQIRPGDGPYIYRKWIGLSNSLDSINPLSKYSVISDNRTLYAVFKEYDLQTTTESLGMLLDYFIFSGSRIAMKTTKYIFGGKIVLPAKNNLGANITTIANNFNSNAITHILFDKDFITSGLTVEADAFRNALALTFFDFEHFESISEIGASSFEGTNLSNQNLCLIENIYSYAFCNSFSSSVTNLTLYLPTSHFGQEAFGNNTSLKTVDLLIKDSSLPIKRTTLSSLGLSNNSYIFRGSSTRISSSVTTFYYPNNISYNNSAEYGENDFISHLRSFFLLNDATKCNITPKPLTI